MMEPVIDRRDEASPLVLTSLPWSTSLRGIMATSVVIWHIVLTVFPDGTELSPLATMAIQAIGLTARESVAGFVVLSGYLLGRGWVGQYARDRLGVTTLRYMARRSLRILPTYWVVITITLIFILFLGFNTPQGTHWDVAIPVTQWQIWNDYLLTSDFATTIPVSHPAWAVPVEYHMYLLAPLIVFFRRWSLLAVGAVGTLALVTWLPEYHATYFYFIFVASFWAGLVRQTMAETSWSCVLRTLWPLMVMAPVVAIAGLATGQLPDDTGAAKYFVADAILAMTMIPLMARYDLLTAAGVRPHLVRFLETRGFRWAGVRSYSIYLIHAVVIEGTWRWCIRPLGITSDLGDALALLPLALILSYGVGNLVYHLIEARSERWSRRTWGKPDMPPPIASTSS